MERKVTSQLEKAEMSDKLDEQTRIAAVRWRYGVN